MSFPFSIKGKFEIKSFVDGNIKPESLRDMIVSSLTDQKYPVHTQNLKIFISTKISQRSVGEKVLSGLSKGEINLYYKGTSVIVEYNFSMVHYMLWSIVFIALLFLLNIKNPDTRTSVGLMGLGLLGFILFCGSYILAAIMTAIKLRKFIERCAREAREAGEKHDSMNKN